MIIESLSLKNYRNYENLNLNFSDGTNIFYGNNAQGKTNILEAVYMSGTTKSHRTNKDLELIRFTENESHISTMIKKNGISHNRCFVLMDGRWQADGAHWDDGNAGAAAASAAAPAVSQYKAGPFPGLQPQRQYLRQLPGVGECRYPYGDPGGKKDGSARLSRRCHQRVVPPHRAQYCLHTADPRQRGCYPGLTRMCHTF